MFINWVNKKHHYMQQYMHFRFYGGYLPYDNRIYTNFRLEYMSSNT